MAIIGTSACLVALSALPAAAHVTVSSPDAAPKGFGKLIFRVPTESETESTVGLTVQLPPDTPFAFVSTKPHPGWTVRTTERKLDKPVKVEGFTLTKAVSSVTWTAGRGDGIRPGEFDEFELSVGPFPEDRDLLFPAAQKYSDGSVVRWDQPTPPDGKEPEHPAPALSLETASPVSAETTVARGSDSVARSLGAAGLALGAVALDVAVLGRRRSDSLR